MSPWLVQQQHQIMSLVTCFTKTMFRYLLAQVAITYFQTTPGQMMEITLVRLQPVKHQGHQRLMKLLSSFCVSYLKTGNPEMSSILCWLLRTISSIFLSIIWIIWCNIPGKLFWDGAFEQAPLRRHPVIRCPCNYMKFWFTQTRDVVLGNHILGCLRIIFHVVFLPQISHSLFCWVC